MPAGVGESTVYAPDSPIGLGAESAVGAQSPAGRGASSAVVTGDRHRTRRLSGHADRGVLSDTDANRRGRSRQEIGAVGRRVAWAPPYAAGAVDDALAHWSDRAPGGVASQAARRFRGGGTLSPKPIPHANAWSSRRLRWGSQSSTGGVTGSPRQGCGTRCVTVTSPGAPSQHHEICREPSGPDTPSLAVVGLPLKHRRDPAISRNCQ